MKTLTIYLNYWSIRLFFLVLISLISFGSYFFSIPQLSISNITLTNPIILETEILPTWLYIVSYSAFSFAISIIIILVLIVYYNFRKNRNNNIDKLFIKKFVNYVYRNLLSAEIYNVKEKKAKLKSFKKTLKNDYAKSLFINTLIKVRSQTNGIITEKSTDLFNTFQYDYLVKSYLHSPYLQHKLFALEIISDFQLEGYDKYILKLTKRKDNALRSQALDTLVKLNSYNNLQFIADLNIKLTIWDINSITKTLQQLKKTNIHYYSLIESNIPEICALGIILAHLNQRRDFKLNIKNKIGNSNNLVNEEAFLAFISFAETQADFDYLINKYEFATERSQIQIIKSMTFCPDKKGKSFFLNWVVENKPIKQKIEALRLLLCIDMSAISRYKHSENHIIKQSCLQVLDINI